METAIHEMPDHARVWVYQANQRFTADQKALINEQLSAFTGQWAAHGQQLVATFSIVHDQFIVLAVDESMHQASGCSIDASVNVIRQIEQQTGLSLLDRTQVAFLADGEVKTYAFNQLKQAVLSGEVKPDTQVFDNTLTNAGEWKTRWVQPAGDTWVSRYF
ncbi:hypothetical protein [Marinoscillum furvescens]|uniref:ABC transporter ATPase n=1 Tax=Marinoscillum furvescens DSM 4134 TaxID=1122208 RepID=A0A3D9L4T3_MARFU|nr:hypothetical protein [Marinoscillum furvescens]REE00529.1 hypothetical protein C7460_105153 [Marinoscillum furvescens DSM 4134]